MSGYASNLVTAANLIPGALATPLFAAGNRIVEEVLIQRPRSIGLIVPNVVIEEQHRDELVVTEHPIERGAAISDHVFKRPSEVTMRAAWSNSSAFGDGTEGYAQFIYDQLLALQVSGSTFDLVTGKRLYRNMVMLQLQVQNDSRWEYGLYVLAIMKEIIIVETQSTALPPTENQALPQQTAPVIDNGTKQPVSVPTANNRSAISGFADIFK